MLNALVANLITAFFFAAPVQWGAPENMGFAV